MMLDLPTALRWTSIITGVAFFWQTLELFSLRKAASDTGIWNWQSIRQDFEHLPNFVRALLDACLGYSGFLVILILRLAFAICMVTSPHPVAIVGAFLTTLMIALRWRGSFNGGSDFMNLIVLSALCIAGHFKDNASVVTACLWYIAIQTCTSYFIAGIIKLRKKNWRTGAALSGFLSTTVYSPDPLGGAIAKRIAVCALLSWAVMLFECSFPMALLNPQLCWIAISIAMLFHLSNFYFFGLNRFVLSWAAAYPALLYCSQLSG
jgi:hypothetical protein